MVPMYLFLATSMLLSGPSMLEPNPFKGATSLCQVLDLIRPGSSMRVTLTGVLVVDTEHQVFYDPEQVVCMISVQPSTTVDYAKGLTFPPDAARILQENHKIKLTIEGDLFGPKELGADRPTLPVDIAYSHRVAGLERYGHLGQFRTKLILRNVLEFEKLSTDAENTRPILRDPRPVDIDVQSASLPRYPERARLINLEGDVYIEATFEAGRLVSHRLLSGDRLLAQGSEECLATWVMPPEVNQKFVVAFRYRLERRLLGSSNETRVEAKLPFEVVLTAKSNDW